MPAYNWGSLHLNDSCLDVKVIIWNDFIYGYTFLGLICIQRKMPAMLFVKRKKEWEGGRAQNLFQF